MRFNFLLISKSILQIVLFSLFLAFFGLPSLIQYQRKEIIVLKSESKTDGIEPPAVTLQAKRNSLGWKTVEKDQFWQSFDLFDHCMEINMTVEDCMKQDSFELEDFLVDAMYIGIGINQNYSAPILFNSSFWKEDMSLSKFGRHFTLKSLKNITQNEGDCLTFVLSRNFSFSVFIHDEDFFLFTLNPLGPPSKFWQFQGESTRNHYQELMLTKHKKLNLERQPCQEGPDYSYSNCIRESLSKKVKKCIL